MEEITELNNDSSLSRADENPWYVLATIYGEEPVFEVENKNRNAWNAWALSGLNEVQKASVAKKNRNFMHETPSWNNIRLEIKVLFSQRIPNRSLPRPHEKIDFIDTFFEESVEFSGFIFPAEVCFSGSRIRNIHFHDVFFFEKVIFEHARVQGNFWVDNTYFYDEACFRETEFCNLVTFSKVLFLHDASFIRSHFLHNVLFKAVSFDGSSYFGFSEFHRRNSFTNCYFNKPSNFRYAEFLYQYPHMEGSIFHEKTTISAEAEFWPEPDSSKQELEDAKVSCALLRHLMNTQGLPEQAHFFFRREMHFASKIGSIWERFPYLLFGWLSNYGHSLKRPLHALTWLWALPAVFFWLKDCTDKCANTIGAEIWISLLKAAGLSIANILKFTGIQRVYYEIKDFDALVPLVSDAQTLLAIPLLFLLLLGLRNRFRLK